MSFSIQEFFFDLLENHIAFFNLVWLPAVFLLAALLLSYCYLMVFYDGNLPFFSNKYFLFICSLFIAVCKIPAFSYGESNLDESQWLASVISIQHSPLFYLKSFYFFDFGRIVTIIPLWLLSGMGFAIDYGLSKLAGLLCWIITIIFYFKLIQNFMGLKTALLSTTLVTVFIATFSGVYIAYNSETPFVALLGFFFYITYTKQDSEYIRRKYFFSGFILSAILLTKEQSIFVIAPCGLYFFIINLKNRHFSIALLFILGGLSGCLLFMSPFLLKLSYEDIHELALQSISYSKFGLSPDKLTLGEKLSFLFFKKSHIFYTLALFSFIVLWFFSNTRKLVLKYFKEKNGHGLLFIVFYVASVYAIVMPHDLFEHYTLFFVLPSAYFLAITIHLLKKTAGHKWLFAYVCVLFLVIGLSGIKSISKEWRYQSQQLTELKSPFSKEILKYASPGDTMLIWGWETRYYVETKLTRASRYWYTSFLNINYATELRKIVIKNYEDDIVTYQPKVIVKLPGGKGRKMESHPSIISLLAKRYTLVYSEDSGEIYLLNQYLY